MKPAGTLLRNAQAALNFSGAPYRRAATDAT
ncbi:MAG: hypothetical protein JWO67_2207 [Streptosporangiaceae bacterium]|nr:hypothetical protein [Streptosporangiaceae bacterium]